MAEGKNQGWGNATGPQGIAGSQALQPPQAPSPTAAPPSSGHAPKTDRFNRNHAGMAITLILAIAVIAVIFIYVRPAGAPGSTTVTSTITANSSYINLTNYVTNSSDLLFGVLNSSQYTRYINGTYGNFTLGNGINATNAYFNTYGLNFTQELLMSPIEFAPGYTLIIPPKYANYTYPIITSIYAYTEPNATMASRFYDYEISSQRVFGSNITLPAYNVTTYFADNFSTTTAKGTPGYNYESKVSEYPVNIGISGVNSTVVDFKDLYNTTDAYALVTEYHNYMIIFEFYGVLGHYNESYGLQIARHYYSVMVNP